MCEFLFHLFDLLFKKYNRLFDGFLAFGVKERKNFHRAFEVSCGYKLFLKLAQHRPFLLEDKDCIASKFVRRRLHLFPIKGYQARINLIRFYDGEHDTGEVLYLQRIFKADGNACL